LPCVPLCEVKLARGCEAHEVRAVALRAGTAHACADVGARAALFLWCLDRPLTLAVVKPFSSQTLTALPTASRMRSFDTGGRLAANKVMTTFSATWPSGSLEPFFL
jgi:hypothetical protein